MKIIKWVVIVLVFVLSLFWYFSTPRINFYRSSQSEGVLHVLVVTPSEKYSADLLPGEALGGLGEAFPTEDFFVRFYWLASGGRRCISVRPKWPLTRIYIDANGEVDKDLGSGTDVGRLSSCPEY